MYDYIALLPQTFQLVAQWLDRLIGPWWPLGLGALFPLYVAMLSVMIWVLRGRAWPVRCIYPKTRRRRPCEHWVAGEWFRCRHHNRRAVYRYGHTVDTSIKRWQRVDSKGRLVDRPAIGMGVVRLRPAGRALLYQNGYARKPLDVLKVLPEFVKAAYGKVGSMRITEPSPGPREEGGEAVVVRNDVADNLESVVGATRFALAAFGAGLVGSICASTEFATGMLQSIIQWLSILGFVIAWAAISAGVYFRYDDWMETAGLKALKWWLTICVPVALLNAPLSMA